MTDPQLEELLNTIKQLEESVALSKLQASALNATVDGIAIVNRNATIKWVNPAYTKLTGYSQEEIIGKNPEILNSGKHPHSFFKNLWHTILNGHAWHGEIWNKRKDGTTYLEEQSITPTFDSNGEINYFIAIKRDISERREFQLRLQQAQKMEAIGQLTGGIAHDFNNMLTSILGYTELAMENLKQNSEKAENKQVLNYLTDIYKSGGRARDLVAQMLEFSRGGEGEHNEICLAPLIKETLSMLAPTLTSSIEFDLQIEDENLTVMSESIQFHQLCMNLCLNARDAMDGQGHITIGLKKVCHLNFHCASCHESIEGDFIQFYIHDTGEGMTADKLERIFDPFYTTKDAGKGTGMGLSMVHGIMHDHGGHLLVDSSKGKGTTFCLLFPAITNQALESHPKIESGLKTSPLNEMKTTKFKQNDIHTGRVLIVDDELSIGFFIKEIMSMEGWETTVMIDSQSALNEFNKDPAAYDLLVTDQTMPLMTGADLSKVILGIRPDLPIILCTGFSQKIDEETALSLGIKGYVNKPIEIDSFLSMAESLVKASLSGESCE